jgi:hypothetical protein
MKMPDAESLADKLPGISHEVGNREMPAAHRSNAAKTLSVAPKLLCASALEI